MERDFITSSFFTSWREADSGVPSIVLRRTGGETAQVTVGLSQILLFIIAWLANKIPRRSIEVP